VAGDGQQGEAPPGLALLGAAALVVAGAVAAVQAAGIDGGLGAVADQAAQAGAAEGVALKLAEPPFCRRRYSA
jgi:hypothetical protein